MDKNVNRLWAVNWINLVGIQAPTLYVEAKTRKEALKLAERSSRLADFPEKWSFKLTPIKTKAEIKEELGLVSKKY